MRLVPCAFELDEQTGLVTPKPAVGWLAAGHGTATRAWDGIPCLIAFDEEVGAFVFYRLDRLAEGDPIPIRSVRLERGLAWVPVGGAEEPYASALTALVGSGRPIEPGGYTLCGPGIPGNAEGFEEYVLLHDNLVTYLRCPRTLDEAIYFLMQQDPPAYGIVWRHAGQACGITRHDVGLEWPSR